ncbi:hypothetical protein BDD12DRAFT_444890 [Trichophaea hybrida]|nr:hypothetical protein BDD12DRAFT_444890 [Trichophaea hybrida]
MANKKARNKAQELDFDLPPSALAKTTNLSSTKARKRKSRSSKKSWETEDDTPKAFSRLISGGGAPPRSGLDNGDSKKKTSKKRKLDAADGSGAGEALKQTCKELKIQPGETLREFGRRVDAAIPVHFPRGDGSLREGGRRRIRRL